MIMGSFFAIGDSLYSSSELASGAMMLPNFSSTLLYLKVQELVHLNFLGLWPYSLCNRFEGEGDVGAYHLRTSL